MQATLDVFKRLARLWEIGKGFSGTLLLPWYFRGFMSAPVNLESKQYLMAVDTHSAKIRHAAISGRTPRDLDPDVTSGLSIASDPSAACSPHLGMGATRSSGPGPGSGSAESINESHGRGVWTAPT